MAAFFPETCRFTTKSNRGTWISGVAYTETKKIDGVAGLQHEVGGPLFDGQGPENQDQ